MRSGRLRHRLELQQEGDNSPARDEYGAPLRGWSTTATVWGAIEPLTGREFFAQQQRQDESTVRIVIRHYSGIDPTWRIRHVDYSTSPGTERIYNITDVQNENTRNRMMILMCREGVSNG